MITVKLNQPGFEYDIHSLVKSFYPTEDVSVTAEEKTFEEPVLVHRDVYSTEDKIKADFCHA